MQIVAKDVQGHYTRAVVAYFFRFQIVIRCRDQVVGSTNIVNDLVAHAWGCGSSHGKRGRIAKLMACFLDKEVIWAEIMTPQTDTVRFIHDKKGQSCITQGTQKGKLPQTFGRGIDE